MDAARPLLTRLRAENVRSFARLDLELGPLTVLVGPNGAGKSNVVSVLRFMRDLALRDFHVAIARQRGWSFVRRRGAEEISCSADVTFEWGAVRGFATLNSDGRAGRSGWLPVPETVVRHDGESYFEALNRIDDSEVAHLNRIGGRGALWMSGMTVYQPDALVLRDQTQRLDSEPVLREDLGNLGAVLLAIRETPFGGRLDRALALLVDGVTGYTVLQAGSTLVPQVLYGPDDARDLGLESDGTIRLVALLAAMYQPVPPSFLVLEEPEMGLHPGVLSALAGFIREASTRMQVLVTTHSPDLVDCFDPDVIRVVEKIDGETQVGPVRPQQREAIRRKLFSPGELMRMEGLQLEID